MTPQPDALPACPPDPALVRGQRFYRALAASMTHVGTDHYGCGHCPRCADFCDGFVAGCESESAQSDIAHALAASRAEVERLRQAAANVAAMYQTDPLTTVDGLTDTDFIMRISALRAALAAQGGGT